MLTGQPTVHFAHHFLPVLDQKEGHNGSDEQQRKEIHQGHAAAPYRLQQIRIGGPLSGLLDNV